MPLARHATADIMNIAIRAFTPFPPLICRHIVFTDCRRRHYAGAPARPCHADALIYHAAVIAAAAVIQHLMIHAAGAGEDYTLRHYDIIGLPLHFRHIIVTLMPPTILSFRRLTILPVLRLMATYCIIIIFHYATITLTVRSVIDTPPYRCQLPLLHYCRYYHYYDIYHAIDIIGHAAIFR